MKKQSWLAVLGLLFFLQAACNLQSRLSSPEAAAETPQTVIEVQQPTAPEPVVLATPTWTAVPPTPVPTEPTALPVLRLVYHLYIKQGEFGMIQRSFAWDASTGAGLPLSVGFPSLSPDGKKILVSGGGDIYLQDIVAGSITRLTRTEGNHESGSWCPDAPDLLSVSVIRPEECGYGCPFRPGVMRLSDGVIRLLDEKAQLATWTARTRDCATFYFFTGSSELNIYKGGQPTGSSLHEYGLVDSTLNRIDGPVLSPDERYLAMMANTLDGKAGAVVLDLEKKTSFRTTFFDNLGHGGWFSGPYWSPDSRYLAVQIDNMNQGEGGYWAARIEDGAVAEEVYLGNAGMPVWSPDSRALVMGNELLTAGSWERRPIDLPEGAQPAAWLTEADFNRLRAAQEQLNACPGAPPQRLEVGGSGRVCTSGDPVLLRSGPGREGDVTAKLAVGTAFDVLAGPLCSNGWSWWNVSAGDQRTGWLAEGGDAKDPYFLCPGE